MSSSYKALDNHHELETRPSSPHDHTPNMVISRQSSIESFSSNSSGSSSSSGGSHIEAPAVFDEEGDLEGQGVAVEPEPTAHDLITPKVSIGYRGLFIRALALLCACALSIGSHYGSYFLGPIKSRLNREMGTSNAQFSLLIASFSLNNTWTPLLGGVLTARLGTAWSSIIATSLIFFGQAILLVGDYWENVRIMAVGLFIFGLGISPLAVVQETIIVRFFSAHGLGISLALGLLAGKGASFVSAISSYPLSDRFGPHAPFLVATILAGLSWVVNLVYLSSSAWFARSTGIALEESEVRAEGRRVEGTAQLSAAERMTEAEALRKISKKRKVKFHNITKLGDIFWAYVGVNVLCGALWTPFMHLSANIIEKRYGLTEGDAGNRASLLMAGSIFLYPICGYLTDRLKTATVVHKMFMLSSVLTLLCFAWLSLPPSWTTTPTPALVFFGGGHGFATLLLVIIVPHLVPIKYVSSALGVHKALEQTGATISQTLSGLLLDHDLGSGTSEADNLRSMSVLLRLFLLVNFAQFLGTIGLWRLQVLQDRRLNGLVGPEPPKGYMSVPRGETDESDVGGEPAIKSRRAEADADDDEEDVPGLSGAAPQHRTVSMRSDRPLLRAHRASRQHRTKRERRRGKAFAFGCGLLIVAAWVLFMSVAWEKLSARE